MFGHPSGASPVVAMGTDIPVFIGPLPTGEPTSLRSVSTPDQGGMGWKHPVLLIFFIYFFINCFTVHSLLSLLFKLYRSSSNRRPLQCVLGVSFCLFLKKNCLWDSFVKHCRDWVQLPAKDVFFLGGETEFASLTGFIRSGF